MRIMLERVRMIGMLHYEAGMIGKSLSRMSLPSEEEVSSSAPRTNTGGSANTARRARRVTYMYTNHRGTKEWSQGPLSVHWRRPDLTPH